MHPGLALQPPIAVCKEQVTDLGMFIDHGNWHAAVTSFFFCGMDGWMDVSLRTPHAHLLRLDVDGAQVRRRLLKKRVERC